MIPGPVRVREEIPAFLFAGGWGDGWSVLHPGALVTLERQEGEQVHFLAGHTDPNPVYGGFFLAEHLDKCDPS